MINLFMLGVLIVFILAIFMLVKLKYIKHKLIWIALIGFAVILYIGFLASTTGQNIDLATPEGAKVAVKLYLGWMGQSFDNLRVLTSHAIKLDWIPENDSLTNPLDRSNRDRYKK